MNGKQQAIDQILDFLKSDEKGLLITGTYQFKKHYLVMALLEKHFKNAKILFRINGMMNIDDDNFTPFKNQPKAGEFHRLKNNYYAFDAFTSKITWRKTLQDYDFAIVYPIDYLCRSGKTEPIEELFQFRNIGKTFFCSWTDSKENDYSLLSDFYSRHVVYDAEEEDISYHNRVLKILEEQAK